MLTVSVLVDDITGITNNNNVTLDKTAVQPSWLSGSQVGTDNGMNSVAVLCCQSCPKSASWTGLDLALITRVHCYKVATASRQSSNTHLCHSPIHIFTVVFIIYSKILSIIVLVSKAVVSALCRLTWVTGHICVHSDCSWSIYSTSINPPFETSRIGKTEIMQWAGIYFWQRNLVLIIMKKIAVSAINRSHTVSWDHWAWSE